MANPSCDAFSSINAALTQANMGQLNITSYVAACPDVCTLAWGTGNPDLSGIGANISYIIQAILTFVFGPLYCLIIYGIRERWNVSSETEKNLKSLQATFHDISAQFSIPVAAAAVVRFLQHAPFYELAFLRSLTTLQFLSLLSSSVAAGIFERSEECSCTEKIKDCKRCARIEKHKEHQRVTILVFYGLLEFGLYMGLIGGLHTSQASWQTLSELARACTAYNRIEPWIKYIPASNTLHITFKQYYNPIFLLKHAKLAFTIIGLFFAASLALTIVCFAIYGLGVVLISKEALLLGPISLAFAIAVLVEVVRMERTRNIMKLVTGTEFQDNQWGFGQVIAVFLWVPLCLQIFYNIFLIIFDSKSQNHTPNPELTNEVAPGPGERPTPGIGEKTQIGNELKIHSEEKTQANDKIDADDRAQSEDEAQSDKAEVGGQ